MRWTPLIGDTPMTNAQRQARWRERHAKKLARKAARRGGHTVANIQDLCDLVPTLEDWAALFAGGVKAERGSAACYCKAVASAAHH